MNSASLIEEQAEHALGLADPLAETVGSLAHKEGHVSPGLVSIIRTYTVPPVLFTHIGALVGKGPGQKRLADPRRPVEQHTTRRLQTKALEDLRGREHRCGREQHAPRGT